MTFKRLTESRVKRAKAMRRRRATYDEIAARLGVWKAELIVRLDPLLAEEMRLTDLVKRFPYRKPPKPARVRRVLAVGDVVKRTDSHNVEYGIGVVTGHAPNGAVRVKVSNGSARIWKPSKIRKLPGVTDAATVN